MARTTILADDALLLEAKYVAQREGKTLTAVIHEALAAYVAAHRQPRHLSLAGAGRSGVPLAAGGEEAALAQAVDPVEGWSPRRPVETDPPGGPALRTYRRGRT